jgi:chromosomal replication initiation ATPase DnaA
LNPLRAKVVKEKYRLQVSVVKLPALIKKVARHYKIDPGDLKSASKERSVTAARRVLCYIAVRKLGYRCTEISKKKMDISAVTVSKAVSLGSKLPQVGKIQKQILDN